MPIGINKSGRMDGKPALPHWDLLANPNPETSQTAILHGQNTIVVDFFE